MPLVLFARSAISLCPSHSDTHTYTSLQGKITHHSLSIIEPTRDALPGLISRLFYPVSTLSKQPRDPQALLRALFQSHASSSFKCYHLHLSTHVIPSISLLFFSLLFFNASFIHSFFFPSIKTVREKREINKKTKAKKQKKKIEQTCV